MRGDKANIIHQLQKDILSLQGFKTKLQQHVPCMELGPILEAFPLHQFPLGAIHEFISEKETSAVATAGFISGLISSLANSRGAVIWVAATPHIFPPALKTFGIDPSNIIFINTKKEKELLWVMEESLKCEGLAAVVGEIPAINFTDSRRLQLAVEKSRVTGFLLRHQPRNSSTTACVTRWKINSLPSALPGDMPGVGFPRWQVELNKVRNGKPGSWLVEWKAGRFIILPDIHVEKLHLQSKTA